MLRYVQPTLYWEYLDAELIHVGINDFTIQRKTAIDVADFIISVVENVEICKNEVIVFPVLCAKKIIDFR